MTERIHRAFCLTAAHNVAVRMLAADPMGARWKAVTRRNSTLYVGHTAKNWIRSNLWGNVVEAMNRIASNSALLVCRPNPRSGSVCSVCGSTPDYLTPEGHTFR